MLLAGSALVQGRDALLVRYPTVHQGRVVFTYLADIWTADLSGANPHRLTAHPARDVYPRFSPDGQSVAFSSDRNGNLDVFVVPAAGGQPRQLTFHSADDVVLGWTPDGKSVLFSSMRGEDFLSKLYTVRVDTGAERPVAVDSGTAGCYSPDGTRLAFTRKGQVYWRKYYRGAYQTDVTVTDLATHKFQDLTDFDGLDSWPMWSRDGHIYFVSDRDGAGLTNIWRVPEKGGKAEKITQFTSGDVRFPSISSDGKTIVFEHEFGAWKLDVASRKASAIKINIDTETQDNPAELRTFASRADDFHVAPNGRRVVFSIHGEIFTAPVEEGDLHQITNDPARDQDPLWSPDGKSIVYISDRSGREELWLAPAEGGPSRKLTDIDALKSSVRWSPDSKQLLFTTSEYKLYKHTLGGATVELLSNKFGQIGQPVWSPDGKWIALSMAETARSTDIFLLPSAGGTPKKVTFDSASERSPRFSADGKKLYFTRASEGAGFGQQIPTSQLYVIYLEKQEKDPAEPDEREAEQAEAAGPRGPRAPQQAAPIKEAQIDWDGLKRRTLQVTRLATGVSTYEPGADSRTLVFVSTEQTGLRPAPVLYTIQDTGKRQTRVGSLSGPPAGEEAGGPGGRGGFGGFGGVQLSLSRDARTAFFLEGGSIYSMAIPATPVGAAAAAPTAGMGGGAGAGAQRKRINFTAKVRINHQAEWNEMFGDAWRTMKYRFYDPKMHGYNWDKMRARYQPLVDFVGDRHELINIINEMIGELNASHTGAAAPPGGRTEGAVSSTHPGLDFEADETANRYKVTWIYAEGPADKDWVKVKAGDYLIAVDGQPVTAADNLWKFFNNERLNRKLTLTFNSKPSEDGAWTTKIEPVSPMAYSQLRYERWVKERRDMAEKLSGGKVGYLHIQAMDQTSLRRFEKDLRENRDKPALVIDQRFNGGGNIEQELLAILVQREYQRWQPRGTEETGRPFAGYFGKKIVLQNWRSASNAEMFPAGFRALGLGKTLGTPTMGAVIGTGSYSLIDGSTVRTPGVGVYLADPKHTNMENLGVKPDIFVENPSADVLSGKDPQLEAAVADLLKQLGK
jgi:tricorn protease